MRFVIVIALRMDFDAGKLRASAKTSRDAGQTRRLLALAANYEGAERSEAARIEGVTRQIVRDWVLKLNKDDFNSDANWSKHGNGPDEWELEENMVKFWLYRAFSKYWQVYRCASGAMSGMFPCGLESFLAPTE